MPSRVLKLCLDSAERRRPDRSRQLSVADEKSKHYTHKEEIFLALVNIAMLIVLTQRIKMNYKTVCRTVQRKELRSSGEAIQ